jgi:hypothetical protein
MDPERAELVGVLREARVFLARPGNDFAWSSWHGAANALQEIDDLITRIESGALPDRAAIEVLFLPTGRMQEVSLSSGWGEEFCELSSRCDRALESVYG